MAKARTRDSTQALGKLTTVKDGRRQIISDPPLIVPIEELAAGLDVNAVTGFSTLSPPSSPPPPLPPAAPPITTSASCATGNTPPRSKTCMRRR